MWRVSEDENATSGSSVQTFETFIAEAVWLKYSVSQFSGVNLNKLPIDHHELLGMVAPRGLLILENSGIDWLAPTGCATSATAARYVFEGLGVRDNIGFSESDHPHCLFQSADGPYLMAFLRKFLLNQVSTDTKAWNIPSTVNVDEPRWIDWTVPTLN